ncbi:MAG: methyltransferase [Candidatus Bathyarchaeota archaeon B24]|nr:MAG: methyltransferase [Candidatus Bathyarchaeota archaeon B24]
MVYVVRLSLFHPTLPRAEVLAVLEAMDSGFKELSFDGRYLRVEAEPEAARWLLDRCAYVKELSEELVSSDDIEGLFRKLSRDMLPNGMFSFAVEADKPVSRRFEPPLGDLIKGMTGWRVDLEKPDILFKLIKVGELYVLAVSLGKASLKGFHSREPKFRPVTHPSTMKPMLARCMVNLARVKPGDVVLDPFCGVGGILLEAGLVGCRVLGLDIAPKLVRGCLTNLRWAGVEPLGLVAGDACKIPFRTFKTFVSDLPYGRAAKTGGRAPIETLEEFLECVAPLVSKGVYACIGVAGLNLDEGFFLEKGFKMTGKYMVKEHKSLVREIIVLRRV